MLIGAEPEPQSISAPWHQRIPRNGTGVHEVTQKDYQEMYSKLAAAGLSPRFSVKGTELAGRKEIDVDGTLVVLNGRCDVKLWDYELEQEVLLELKTVDKRTNWTKIKEPKPEHQLQAIAYSILFGIPRCIFQYESLQKPQYTKVDETDLKCFYFETTPEMEQALLSRLAGIVRAVEAKEPPQRELEKCMFCGYKSVCANDG